MSYDVFTDCGKYVRWIDIFQSNQVHHSFALAQKPPYYIIDDTIYFTNEFNGNIEDFYCKMDFVSKIVFDIYNYTFCSENSQPFLPRANITHITIGNRNNRMFVSSRYITHVKFKEFSSNKLFVLSIRMRCVWFNNGSNVQFNQKIDMNKNMSVWHGGYSFNQSFKPNKAMCYLSFEKIYNKPFNSGLSKNITHLIFNGSYNLRIDLPKKLYCLKLYYNSECSFMLGPNIKYLYLKKYNNFNCSNIISDRTCINLSAVIYCLCEDLPNGIKHVVLPRNNCSNIPNHLLRRGHSIIDACKYFTAHKHVNSNVEFRNYH